MRCDLIPPKLVKIVHIFPNKPKEAYVKLVGKMGNDKHIFFKI